MIYEVDGLKFEVREESTDRSIVDEVIKGKAYLNDFIDVKEGDIVVDVGAHIGSFSIMAAAKGATVLAFEPAKINFDLFIENITLNNLQDLIIPVKKGIRAEAGTKTLRIRDRNFGGTSFFNIPSSNPAFQEEVECITPAEMMEDTGHIDYLKLDCEQSELEVLQGLDLSKIDKIAVEWENPPRRFELLALLGDYEIEEHYNDTFGMILAKRK